MAQSSILNLILYTYHIDTWVILKILKNIYDVEENFKQK